MKTRLLSICLTFFSLTSFSQNKIVSNIEQKLGEYYQFYPSEKIQFTTDKDVYKPEEIIWFSALITNSNNQQSAPTSGEFTVSLYADNGVKITGDVFKTSAGIIKGDLLLPKGMAEGKYVLVASTPLMSNANEVFHKLIYINPKNEQAIRLKETECPEYLKPGTSNKFSFVLENMSGEPLKNPKLKFELYHKNDIILKDKVKSDGTGQIVLNLTIPEQEYDEPLKLVISTNKNELNYSKTLPVKNEKIKICFYPEGSQLRVGTPQKIGFKVTDQFGQAISIEGEILEESGNKLTQIKTSIPGFGVFPVIVEKGKKYTLQVSSEIGNKQEFELPKIGEGLSMSIARLDSNFIYVNIVPQRPETIYLLANKGASVFWASEMIVEESARLKIPKNNFPHGISMLSVFNNQGQALGCRLIFIDKQANMNLKLTSPDKVKAGQVFKFSVQTDNQSAKDPAQLNMAISAASENQEWPNHWDSWQLINADLENEIHNIDRLTEDTNTETTMNYLLIANRLKNFEWNKVLHFDQGQEQNKYQESGVFGKVVDKNGEIVPKAKVSLMNSQNMQILNSSADEYGEFFIQGIDVNKLNDFAIKAIGPDGKEDLHVTFERSMTEQIADHIKAFVQEHASLEQVQFESEFYRKNEALFSKIKTPTKFNSEIKEEPYKRLLKNSTSLLEVIKTIKPFRLDGDKIIFPGGTNSLLAQDGALIVVDGQKMGTSTSVLNSFSPFDVESINVSTNPVDIQRYTGLNSVGLIEISTKRGAYEKKELQPLESPYENGFRVPRDFWLQKAENPEQQPTTLFWNPSVTINENGHWEFEVASNKVLGEFQIRVDVVDKQGRISETSRTFEVVP